MGTAAVDVNVNNITPHWSGKSIQIDGNDKESSLRDVRCENGALNAWGGGILEAALGLKLCLLALERSLALIFGVLVIWARFNPFLDIFIPYMSKKAHVRSKFGRRMCDVFDLLVIVFIGKCTT